MSIEDQMAKLGRMAAEVDSAEGGHRTGMNVAALLAWGANLKLEHGRCGKLELVRDETGGALATICPVHGRFEAPEWVEGDA